VSPSDGRPSTAQAIALEAASTVGEETAGDAVRALIDHVARVTGGEDAVRLVQFADGIPRPLTGYVGVEVALDEPRPRPDFLAHVERPTGLTAPGVHAALAPFGPDLERVRMALCEAPPRLTEPLHDCWLEWDLSDPHHRQPSVFAAPSVADATGDNAVWVYEAINGQRASPEMRASAEALGRTLSGAGVVMQVGAMAPRRAARCRVVVTGEDVDALLTAAREAGWPGTPADADVLAGWATALEVYGVVDLDLGADGFLPSIGVELYVRDRAAHRRMIAAVRDAGLCHPEVAAALDDWRIVVTPADTDAFPGRLLRTGAFLESHVSVAVIGWLNHVKISTQPDGMLRAKAYLGIRECVIPVATTL
jgi:hypothetical protein